MNGRPDAATDLPPLQVALNLAIKYRTAGGLGASGAVLSELRDAIVAYGDACAADAVLAERERLSSPEAVAEAAMLLGAFSADGNASAKALFDAAKTLFGAETVAAVLTKYKPKKGQP